jgi:rhodanese-related sulfurtransferase
MLNLSKQVAIYTASVILLTTTQLAYGAPTMQQPHAKSTQNTIQDLQKAQDFFKEEMSYKINPFGVKKAIEEKANITIVDVRSAKDYAEGHIPGAINIPYEKHSGFHGNETEFPGLRKDGYNYVYCYELLCDLAKDASIKFASVGYPVKEMAGGFKSWKEKELPIEK